MSAKHTNVYMSQVVKEFELGRSLKSQCNNSFDQSAQMIVHPASYPLYVPFPANISQVNAQL